VWRRRRGKGGRGIKHRKSTHPQREKSGGRKIDAWKPYAQARKKAKWHACFKEGGWSCEEHHTSDSSCNPSLPARYLISSRTVTLPSLQLTTINSKVINETMQGEASKIHKDFYVPTTEFILYPTREWIWCDVQHFLYCCMHGDLWQLGRGWERSIDEAWQESKYRMTCLIGDASASD
jgi:hypothetical protein